MTLQISLHSQTPFAVPDSLGLLMETIVMTKFSLLAKGPCCKCMYRGRPFKDAAHLKVSPNVDQGISYGSELVETE
jgi:hypothetical protein